MLEKKDGRPSVSTASKAREPGTTDIIDAEALNNTLAHGMINAPSFYARTVLETPRAGERNPEGIIDA